MPRPVLVREYHRSGQRCGPLGPDAPDGLEILGGPEHGRTGVCGCSPSICAVRHDPFGQRLAQPRQLSQFVPGRPIRVHTVQDGRTVAAPGIGLGQGRSADPTRSPRRDEPDDEKRVAQPMDFGTAQAFSAIGSGWSYCGSHVSAVRVDYRWPGGRRRRFSSVRGRLRRMRTSSV